MGWPDGDWPDGNWAGWKDLVFEEILTEVYLADGKINTYSTEKTITETTNENESGIDTYTDMG
jgi:hypothetical protein